MNDMVFWVVFLKCVMSSVPSSISGSIAIENWFDSLKTVLEKRSWVTITFRFSSEGKF